MKFNPLVDHAVICATERARRQLGRALHDTVCQTLASVSLCADTLARRSARGHLVEPAALGELTTMLHKAIEQARSLHHKLCPIATDAAGLLEALANLAADTAVTHPCEFVCEKVVPIRRPELALAFYCVAQEAVANAVAHARATKISILLQEITGRVAVTVLDDGCGFAPRSSEGWTGIALMEAYARQAGAELLINSSSNGTTVVCQELQPAIP